MTTSSYIGERGPFQKTNRSAFLNYLRSKYEMYTGALRVQSYPYFLTLEPSDVCQLRCPTCVTGIENEYRRKKNGEPLTFRSNRSKLSTTFFDQLLDEMGEYLFLIIFYNFGEPLLNADLPQLIRKAKQWEIETDINTNLSLKLSDERIEDLLTSGIDYIYTSIDGFTQETYEVHRVGGNIELVKNNLERLVKARERLGLDTTITYNMLVFSFNEHEVDDARQYAGDLGINFNSREAFVHNPNWLPSHRKGEQPKQTPLSVLMPDEFGDVVTIGDSKYKRGEQIQVWSPLPDVLPPQPSRCGWHYGYSVVTAGGSVAPCCGVAKEDYDFGQLKPGETSFADVWNNPFYQKSRADFAGKHIAEFDGVNNICARCPLSPFMFHMYSLHDFKVLAQFQQVLQGSDAGLDQAFDLLSKARYGISIEELIPPGRLQQPEQLLERDDPQQAAEFVQYYEQQFMATGSPGEK